MRDREETKRLLTHYYKVQSEADLEATIAYFDASMSLGSQDGKWGVCPTS